MTDIAALGLAVDSRPVTAATSALNSLTAAAKPAAAAAAGLEKSVTAAGRRAGAMGGSMTQLSFQLNDIASGLAMGQSPFQILAQQGGQVFQVWQMNNNIFKQAGSLLLSMITPMRLLGVGAVAATAAGYALNASWKSTELQFDDTAKSIQTTVGKLHALESAASAKGIDTEEFLKASDQFGKNVYQARNNMGSLADVFRANNMHAGDFEKSLGNVADLIKRSSGDTQKQFAILRDAGLPATMEWVRLLSGGREAIARALEEAKRFDDTANGSMIQKAREFDEAWAKAWKGFANNARLAVIETKSALADTGEAVTAFFLRMNPGLKGAVGSLALKNGTQLSQGDANDFYGKVGIKDPAEEAAKDQAALRANLSLEQQRIGLLGQTASALEQVRAVEISIQQARLNGVTITQQQEATLKRLAAEQAIGLTAIRAGADAYRVEAETVGMSTQNAVAYAAAQNAINDAKRAGRPLTEQNIEAIRREAAEMGQAAQHGENMRFAYEGLVRGPLQAFRSELMRGASFFDALKKGGLSALDSISSKLMDMAAQNLFLAAFGGGGGGGGFLSALFGGFGGAGSGKVGGIGSMHTGGMVGIESGPSRYIHPAHFNDAPRFHSGGLVGGEVPIIAKKGEGVFTPAQMKALAPAGSGAPVVNIYQTNTFTNADPGSEARMRSALEQTKNQAVQEAVAAVSNVSGNTPAYRRTFQ